MEGIILNIVLGDPIQIKFRKSNGSLLSLKYHFKPVIYVEKNHFNRLKPFLPLNQIDHFEEVIKVVNPCGDKRRLIKISFKNFLSFHFFKKRAKQMFIPIYNLDMYEEQQFLRVPTLNLIDLKTQKTKSETLITGEYLGELEPEPPPLNVAKIDQKFSLTTPYGENINIREIPCTDLRKIIDRDKIDILIVPRGQYLDKLNTKCIGEETLVIEEENLHGIAALSEKAYFTYLSPQRVIDVTIGNSVDARQCYFAQKMGWVLPRKNNNNAFLKPAKFFYEIDKGGIIIAPKPGLYRNVIAIDFVSMFPNIIMKYNLSYETCTPDGVIDIGKKAFLPLIVSEPLERRMHFRKLRKSNRWAFERYQILKLLLVATYGYSGKLDNRFGNALCNMYINTFSRKIMEKAISIAKNLGFSVIYSDTDSLFLERDNIDLLELNKLEKLITASTKLPIDIENHFKYLVFPISKTKRGANLKRYFGLTIDNKLVLKGITAVRRDAPKIVREAQIKMIKVFFITLDKAGLEAALREINSIYSFYRWKILSSDITTEDLVIEKKLNKDLDKYVSNPVHRTVAEETKVIRKGSVVSYILLASKSSNRNNRAIPPERFYGNFDREKYLEMLTNARDEVLSFINKASEQG